MFLADLTWFEAARVLTRDAVVMLPLGAGAKEHGPHLRLDNDQQLADALSRRVLAHRPSLIVAPTLAHHHYPAFVDYPGSISLRPETARDLVVDVCTSLAAHGPRRFYVLNTGLSTMRPLESAARELQTRGILLRFTDFARAIEEVAPRVLTQPEGTHADEGETSMMLVLAPDRVDMSKAVRDIGVRTGPRLTRDPSVPGLHSPSGVYGDATLASRAKGEVLVEHVVRVILADLDALSEVEP